MACHLEISLAAQMFKWTVNILQEEYLTAFPCAELGEREKSGGGLGESHLKPAEHPKWEKKKNVAMC